MLNLKTAAAYIRVSTNHQTELSPDSQIKVIQEYAKRNNYIIPKDFIFRDDGISGRYAEKRPQFIQMVATAKQKPSPFSAVLLWKFSRFARNQEESIFYKSMFKRNGIEVISVSEPMVDGAFGTLIERIIEWSDEYYSIRLSGEVKRGMMEKVERGGAVSIPSYGYNIENGKFVINPETAPIVKKIFSDYLNGVPSRKIAETLNKLKIKTTRGNTWENRSIDYILQNPVYIGKIRWNPKHKTKRNFSDKDTIIVNGLHKPLIDKDDFNKVQTIINENKLKYKSYVHSNIQQEYMLHGFVKCSNCGASLTMSAKGTSLQCVNYIHGKCNVSHSITLKKINNMVISLIKESFETRNFNLIIKQKEETKININDLIEKEKLKLQRIKEAYEDGIYTLDELKKSKQEIETQIKKLSLEIKAPVDKENLKIKLVEKNKVFLKQLLNPKVSETEKNNILSNFIDNIIFNRKSSSLDIFFYTF